MKYTVVWTPAAEADLATIWMEAEDQKAIAGAANAIDSTLQFDAHLCGESREGRRLILIAPPLGIDFRPLPEDRLVRVLTVWRIRPHA